MKNRCSTLIACLLLAAPLWGDGTVYVPLAVDQEYDGYRLRTEVRATNDSADARELTYLFLPERTDGTDPDRASQSVGMTLAPHQSLLLSDLLAPGARGLLEITAEPQISVTSRLVGVKTGGEPGSGADLPVVGSGNAVAAGETAVLQGWRRDGLRSTDFFLLNLGHTAAECTAAVYRRAGTLITQQTFPMPPLTLAAWEDVLNLVGEARRNEVSATVTCDQPFYPFAVEVDEESAEVVHISPSGSGRSTLSPPRSGPTWSVDCPDSAVFAKLGAFFRPQPGAETRRFDIPMDDGVLFTRLRVDVDFTPGDWSTENPDGNHAVFWFNRTEAWRSNVFGYVNVFGPNKYFAKIFTNADLEAGGTHSFKQDYVFEKDVRYHVAYIYETSTGLMEAVFTINTGQSDEEEVVRVTGTTTANVIRSEAPGFFVYFGHPIGTVGPEVPTYGWLYSSLCVQLE